MLALLGDVRPLEFPVDLLLVRRSLWGGIRTKGGRGQETSVLMARSVSVGSCLGGSYMSGESNSHATVKGSQHDQEEGLLYG